MDEVTWLELLVRICAGEASEVPCEGVVEVSSDDEDGTRTSYRVQKDRHRWRVSTLDGDPVFLQVEDRSLRFDGDEVSIAHGDGWELSHEVGSALRRREPWDWQGDDFTTPTGPPRATTYLGRDAWEVELAPPPHKESPLVMVVDARDGRILAQWSVLFGEIFRWTELRDVDPFAEDVFDGSAPGEDAEQVTWFAQGLRGIPEELREQHEAEEREAAAIAGRLGLDDILMPASGDVHVSMIGDGFVGFWSAEGHVRFGRRRVAEPDDEDGGVSVTWVDGDWHWFVQGHGVAPASVESFAERLRAAQLD